MHENIFSRAKGNQVRDYSSGYREEIRCTEEGRENCFRHLHHSFGILRQHGMESDNFWGQNRKVSTRLPQIPTLGNASVKPSKSGLHRLGSRSVPTH
jgi:hypothetical protein